MTTVLKRYELQGRLGTGGMAEVWLARASGPSGFEKQVVVKRILPQLAGDPTVEALFKAEARIAARLDHPNLLQVFDFGQEPDGSLVLVMELIDGASLRSVVRAAVRGQRLDPRLIAKLMAQVCEGLHAAHELRDEKGTPLNLVHRDISPENILLARSGAVKVADFGIARIEREVQLTAVDTFRGKIGYASPEQIMGEPVTRQADVWAIGVTMFELLTGQKPFATETEAELASATVHRTPRRVDELRPDCPIALVELVDRCLSKDLARRWPDGHELSKQLEDFVSWTGSPVRSADLGAILTQLDIKPHTVTAAGTPSLSSVPSFATYVEPSTFEPIAELAADGSLHALDVPRHPPPAEDAKSQPDVKEAAPSPVSLGREPKARSSMRSGEEHSSPEDELAPARMQERFDRIAVEPLAVAIEPLPVEAAAPAPARGGPIVLKLLLGVCALAIGGLIVFGISRLPRRAPAAAHGTLFIESTPSGAAVSVNGEPVGQTPWGGDNPAGNVTSITLSRSGYATSTLRLDGGTDWTGTVKLSRQR
jgi:eukaryotic-like serine/threonine-protein kinase